MAESAPPVRYCLHCAAENAARADLCRRCGRELHASTSQRRRGAAFILNELEALRSQGAIAQSVYLDLRRRYREAFAAAGEKAPPTQEPVRAAKPTPAPKAPPPKAPPLWLAEQQASLLLYLGAFLTVIATLIYVSSSAEGIRGGVSAALLVMYTLAFMAGGLLCMRFPRVRQAGVVFFGVAALMVPLNFVGAYVFILSDADLAPVGLWLAGSLTCLLFYGAVSLLGLGAWYPLPTIAAALSALGGILVLADAPPDAYPGSYIGLAVLLGGLSVVPNRHIRETFGRMGDWAAHLVVPSALLAAVLMAAASADAEDGLELSTRWYLPPTIAIAALFYWIQAALARRVRPVTEPVFTVTALAVTGGAAVSLVYALDVSHQWYGPAVAILGWLYAAGVEGIGPRWFGQRHLRWMALVAISASWLLFEGLYGDFPRAGAGVHFSAAIFYLAAARLVQADLPLFEKTSTGQAATQRREHYQLALAVPFLYAAALVLGIGYFHLLSSLPAAETAEASDLGLAFLGPSLVIAAIAATTRWWWPDMRPHLYGVALGTSLFVLLSSADSEGRVTLLLAVYAVVALAVALWEWEPLALPLSAAYGFFALLAAWRLWEPDDAYLPLALSGIGFALFAARATLRNRAERWSEVVQVLAVGYAAVAPIAGWIRLGELAGPEGFVGGQQFEETLLYQTSAASVLLLGLLVGAEGLLVRRIDIAAGASALAMVALLLEIGHFRPENVQAYTAPLGAYLLAGGLLASRSRGLPTEVRPLIGPLESLGAAVIMGPSFLQSLDEGAWHYGVLLLSEGLLFVSVSIAQRRIWLLGTSIAFVVADGLHYLFFTAGPALPNWAILAIAGTAVMAAGVAILLGRDRWTHWQRRLQAWWSRESLTAPSGQPDRLREARSNRPPVVLS